MTATTEHVGTQDAGSGSAASDATYRTLARLHLPCYIVATAQGPVATNELPGDPSTVLAAVGPMEPSALGSPAFRRRHGVRYAYMGGAMAGGIASEELVEALARAGYLGSFGAAGLLPDRVDTALRRFGDRLPGLPWAVNLIHSPSEESLERDGVELFLKHGVRCVEASAFMDLTPHVVRYRVAGLRRGRDGAPVADNRIVAKVSRAEVAGRFMLPAPPRLVERLLEDGLVTPEQAELARWVPMADDVTAEADSGGHTDRRPLTALFPALLAARDDAARRFAGAASIGLGAGGGLGTPRAVAATFALGADYVVVGSVHQSCVESGTSDRVRALLAAADLADVGMAPAADMFELGVELQVLKRGTLFAMRARRLYELYRRCDGLDAIPAAERAEIERTIFRRPLDEVWEDVREYFTRRDPDQLRRAEDSPKRRMALVFRWYLGMASRWAVTGDADRAADYQVWCGPAMGAFNRWVRGTRLEAPAARTVDEVAGSLMRGTAFATRVHQLTLAGVRLPRSVTEYRPVPAGAPGEDG